MKKVAGSYDGMYYVYDYENYLVSIMVSCLLTINGNCMLPSAVHEFVSDDNKVMAVYKIIENLLDLCTECFISILGASLSHPFLVIFFKFKGKKFSVSFVSHSYLQFI